MTNGNDYCNEETREPDSKEKSSTNKALDTISRQAALDCVTYDVEYTMECIKKLPSAEPESAQWVQMLINPNLYKCSNCQVAWNKRLVFDNDGYSENIFMKYCPCCGRKMLTKVDYE